MRLLQDRRAFVLPRDHRGDTYLASAGRYVPDGEVYQLRDDTSRAFAYIAGNRRALDSSPLRLSRA